MNGRFLQEFPVVLLYWVPDDGLTDETENSKLDPSNTVIEAGPASTTPVAVPSIVLGRTAHTASGESSASRAATDSGKHTVLGEGCAQNTCLQRREPTTKTNGTDEKDQDESDHDETDSEVEVEALMFEDVEAEEPVYQGKKKLVIKDQFHSYVRPVWQPKLSTFCSGLTGISQVSTKNTESFTTCSRLLILTITGNHQLRSDLPRDGQAVRSLAE